MAPTLTLDAPLARGAHGPLVRLAQEWLCLHLANPYPARVDDRPLVCPIDGDFGPATEATVRMFQAVLGEPRTGVLEPHQFAQLVAPMANALQTPLPRESLAETVVAVAAVHLKSRPREVGGDNRGPWVRLYCGGFEGVPWCAGFVSWVTRQAATLRRADSPLLPELACDLLARDAHRRDAFLAGNGLVPPIALQPGALFLVKAPSGADRQYHHAGIVTAVHGDHIETIEGNTNEGGNPNGYGVFARRRGYPQLDFIRLENT